MKDLAGAGEIEKCSAVIIPRSKYSSGSFGASFPALAGLRESGSGSAKQGSASQEGAEGAERGEASELENIAAGIAPR